MPPARRGSLEVARPEGVADAHLSALKSLAEPRDALRRGAVGEALGHDAALAAPLQRVIADLSRRVESRLHVARLQPLLDLVIEACPDTRQTVGLQLHTDLQGV